MLELSLQTHWQQLVPKLDFVQSSRAAPLPHGPFFWLSHNLWQGSLNRATKRLHITYTACLPNLPCNH